MRIFCLYILERYIAGYYMGSTRNLDILKKDANLKILEALKTAHPNKCTANQLKSLTKLPLHTVYSSLKELRREGYAIDISAKKGRGVKPSQEYLLEDCSSILQTLFDYQLSPGNIKL